MATWFKVYTRHDEVWKAGDGREIRIKDLTDEHLINILNWIEQFPRGGIPNSEQATEKYFYLRLEAMSRGLRWREYAGQKLREGDLKWAFERRISEFVGKDVAVKFKNRSTAYGEIESIEVLDTARQPKQEKVWRVEDVPLGRKFKVKGKDAVLRRCRLYGEVARCVARYHEDINIYTGRVKGLDGVDRYLVVSDKQIVWLEPAKAEVELL